MKGGKHGRKRPPGERGAKGKAGGHPASRHGGAKPRSVAPKKGARRKPFGGSSSAGEE